MKTKFLYLSIIMATIVSCKEETKNKEETIEIKHPSSVQSDSISKGFEIEIFDNEALTIIDPKSKIEILGSGFEWTEGPLWVEDGSFLLFSDVMANKIYKWNQKENDVSVFLEPSGYTGEGNYSSEPGSNGLILDKEGNLILMQHGDRRVATLKGPLQNSTSGFKTVVDNFEGKKFNSPNDGFLDSAGNLYFTDPPYGLPRQMDDPTKELDFQGVYCLLKNGDLKLLDTLSRPNGIAPSPDGKKLYVAVSDPSHAVWYSYDIEAPGTVTNKNLFYDVTKNVDQKNAPGLPDGMKVNSKGYVFASGPDGIWVFSPSSKLLARIHTGQATSNCAFNSDKSRLFITADDYLLTLDLL